MNNRYREEEKQETLNTETTKTMENEKTNPSVDASENVENREEKQIPDQTTELKAQIEALQVEVNKYRDLYLRSLAEMENFKKRINEERIRERKYFNQGLMEKLVDALDIFDKTVNIETDDEKLKNFLIGFKMINNNLKQILEAEGVKLIVSLGQPFNPAFHHAIDTGYDERYEEDVVIEEIQRGYLFKDRLLRPALVKVNKKNKEEKKDE